MNITKYGVASPCGYGFTGRWIHSDDPDEYWFSTNVSIIARSAITTDSSLRLAWKPEKFSDLTGIARFVYVVFDGTTETWHEYFSGLNVAVASDVSRLDNRDFNVDEDRIPQGVLSAIRINECDSARFAYLISEYKDNHTDGQIKEFVQQLRTMAEDAPKWKKQFDLLVSEVKDERAKKEAAFRDRESELAAGFGQYGDSPLKKEKEPSREESASGKQASSKQPENPQPRERQPKKQNAPGRVAIAKEAYAELKRLETFPDGENYLSFARDLVKKFGVDPDGAVGEKTVATLADLAEKQVKNELLKDMTDAQSNSLKALLDDDGVLRSYHLMKFFASEGIDWRQIEDRALDCVAERYEEAWERAGEQVGARRRTRQAKFLQDIGNVKPNDPCPCGSGKKYKNCCGKETGPHEGDVPVNQPRNNGGGWGPARQAFTMEEPATFPTFNSITDNPTIGDERGFVRIGEINPGQTNLRSSVQVVPGKQYLVYIYCHNNASATFNDSAHDHRGVAMGVRLSSSFSKMITPDSSGYVTATITAYNTEPRSVWAEARMTATSGEVKMSYVAGTAKIYNDFKANKSNVFGGLFIDAGILLGLDELNGVIPGCEEYHCVVSYILQAS